MAPYLLHGTFHPGLSERVEALAGAVRVERRCTRFPDGECEVELLSDVRGQDVYLLQPLGAPVGEHLLEFQLLADAVVRGGARRLTAVVPYLGYARQDRRLKGNEALGSKVVAQALSSSVDRVVLLDVHSPAVEGGFSCPVFHLSAEPVLAERLLERKAGSVVVSPDLGAVKLAERYADKLGVPLAVVHKQRLSGSEVSARGVVGSVKGMLPILVDDMISTAGTMCAAAEVLLGAGCLPDFTVVATHGLLVGNALERLSNLPLKRLLLTDSLPRPSSLPFPVEEASVAPLLSQALVSLSV